MAMKVPAFLLLTALVTSPAWADDHVMPSVQPATTYPDVEIHAKEKVAIAAEPYDTKEKAKIFRVDYLAHGIMPIWLVVTNNGDRPISLRDARILFQTADGDRIQAAEPEDVERLMTRKEREGGKIPLPGLPSPHPHSSPRPATRRLKTDFDQFEYGALVVEPHTTRAGFLFYNVSDLDHPLQGAKLHLRELTRRRRKSVVLFRDSLRQISADQSRAR